MRNLTFFAISVFISCFINNVTSINKCSWNSECRYKYFSSKTPYGYIRGDFRDSILKLKGCTPVSIWGLIRHGQRHPGIDFAKHMKDSLVIKDDVVSSYEKGNCSLCAQDVENLQNWQPNMEVFDRPSHLTKVGYQETEGIGRRMKQAFPKLLGKLERNDYLFRPAEGAWMVDSAKGFIEGLQNKQLTVQEPKKDFDILSPYLTCDKYISEVKNNPETFAESVKYMSSSDYLASKDGIQRRLGLDYHLTDINITALYDLCRYTSSGLTNQFSPWCALFTTDDLKALEYIADLRHYYKSSYGLAMSELFGQIILTDLLKSFQEAKAGNGKKITAYVTHATMMDMVYTALKLFKDDAPLTSLKRKPDRKWRSSKLTVFAANLIAVLNKCQNGDDDYNVVFYLNEEPLQSICKEGVCTWKEFENKLSPFTKTNADFCKLNVTSS